MMELNYFVLKQQLDFPCTILTQAYIHVTVYTCDCRILLTLRKHCLLKNQNHQRPTQHLRILTLLPTIHAAHE